MSQSTSLAIDAGFLLAFDPERQSHVLWRGGRVVVEDGAIREVVRLNARSPSPMTDRYLDSSDKLVIPGLVNLHTHVFSPFTRSFLEDQGSNRLGGSTTLYEHLPYIRSGITPQDMQVGIEFGLMELLRTGSTTAVILQTSNSHDSHSICYDIAAKAAEFGIRVFVTPMHSSAHHEITDEGLQFIWNEDAGKSSLAEARKFVTHARDAYGSTVQGLLGPRQTELCSPELLRATRDAANEDGVRLQVHAAQSLVEVNEILRRHSMTPIEFLDRNGLVADDVILGHCVYTRGHSLFPGGDEDLEIISSRGASIAHCPWIFARRGTTLESLRRYRKAGINIGIGTDSFPQDMVREMRWAMVTGKLAEADNAAATIRDVFDAATLGGATALGRHDLGRIAPGARADLVMFSLNALSMTPVRDPMKNLLYSCTGEDVDSVIVDGRILVQDGVALFADQGRIAKEMQAAAERVWGRLPDIDRISSYAYESV